MPQRKQHLFMQHLGPVDELTPAPSEARTHRGQHPVIEGLRCCASDVCQEIPARHGAVPQLCPEMSQQSRSWPQAVDVQHAGTVDKTLAGESCQGPHHSSVQAIRDEEHNGSHGRSDEDDSPFQGTSQRAAHVLLRKHPRLLSNVLFLKLGHRGGEPWKITYHSRRSQKRRCENRGHHKACCRPRGQQCARDHQRPDVVVHAFVDLRLTSCQCQHRCVASIHKIIHELAQRMVLDALPANRAAAVPLLQQNLEAAFTKHRVAARHQHNSPRLREANDTESFLIKAVKVMKEALAQPVDTTLRALEATLVDALGAVGLQLHGSDLLLLRQLPGQGLGPQPAAPAQGVALREVPGEGQHAGICPHVLGLNVLLCQQAGGIVFVSFRRWLLCLHRRCLWRPLRNFELVVVLCRGRDARGQRWKWEQAVAGRRRRSPLGFLWEASHQPVQRGCCTGKLPIKALVLCTHFKPHSSGIILGGFQLHRQLPCHHLPGPAERIEQRLAQAFIAPRVPEQPRVCHGSAGQWMRLDP
mmetsp:Transcript_10659/g.25091  ORF Transcript_10659/g.25091 Transcript_10659/m.25091 type:complete len:527 (+) Transcript_10659:1147-2727(+)